MCSATRAAERSDADGAKVRAPWWRSSHAWLSLAGNLRDVGSGKGRSVVELMFAVDFIISSRSSRRQRDL